MKMPENDLTITVVIGVVVIALFVAVLLPQELWVNLSLNVFK